MMISQSRAQVVFGLFGRAKRFAALYRFIGIAQAEFGNRFELGEFYWPKAADLGELLLVGI